MTIDIPKHGETVKARETKRYVKPAIRVMSEEEMLAAFQVAACASGWWN